jgi:hypothetical protein
VILICRPRREDQRDRFGEQAAGDEGERVHRGLVEPLGVVDEADQGLILCDVGQQAQRGKADQETVGCVPAPQGERRLQRIALGGREPIEPVEERRAELVEPGERELHLGLDTSGARDAAPGCVARQVLQQRRLADPGFATQDEHPAPPLAGARQELVQRVALAAATTQAPRTAPGHHHRRSSTRLVSLSRGPSEAARRRTGQDHERSS